MEEIIKQVLIFFGVGMLILIALSFLMIGLFALVLKILKEID